MIERTVADTKRASRHQKWTLPNAECRPRPLRDSTTLAPMTRHAMPSGICIPTTTERKAGSVEGMTNYAKRSLMEVALPMSGWLVGFCENTWSRMSSFRKTQRRRRPLISCGVSEESVSHRDRLSSRRQCRSLARLGPPAMSAYRPGFSGKRVRRSRVTNRRIDSSQKSRIAQRGPLLALVAF